MTRPCPQCGVVVGPADGYCEECGYDLLVSRSSPASAAALPCASCDSAEISSDGYCEQCGTRAPVGRDRLELALGPIAGVTDRGARGGTNEDAMALATVRRIGGWDATEWAVGVVCDGISSARRPQDASLAAAEFGLDAVLGALRSGLGAEAATRAGVSDAVAAVRTLARPDDGNNPPSCTYVSAIVSEQAVTIGWLGDSRAYWLSADGSACLTSDDSWAMHMVTARALSAEEAFADRRAHTLVRWVGADATDTEPRVRTVRPPGPGAVLVCSDGLWNYQPDADELAAMALPLGPLGPFGAAKELTRFALDAGGHDNITVVLVSFPPDRSAP